VLENEPNSDRYWEERSLLKEAQDNLTQARERLARGTGQDVFQEELLQIKDFWTVRAAQLAMEKAESALTQAKNNRDKAKLALDKARSDQYKAKLAVDKDKLALDKARSDLDSAKDELDKAVVYAPFAGTIAKVDAKPGDSLSSVNYATEIIIEIIDPSRMEFVVEVDEIDIPQVRPGQRAIISLDALPSVQIDGQVTVISSLPTEEAGVILYEVKVGFDVPEGYALKAGMTATAEIIIDKQSDVLLVPTQTITLDSQGNPVVKVMVNEQMTERKVVTGISSGSQTQILNGLNEGELVVVEVEE